MVDRLRMLLGLGLTVPLAGRLVASVLAVIVHAWIATPLDLLVGLASLASVLVFPAAFIQLARQYSIVAG